MAVLTTDNLTIWKPHIQACDEILPTTPACLQGVDMDKFHVFYPQPFKARSQICEKRLLASLCPSVRPSARPPARMEQLVCHWTGFHEL